MLWPTSALSLHRSIALEVFELVAFMTTIYISIYTIHPIHICLYLHI